MMYRTQHLNLHNSCCAKAMVGALEALQFPTGAQTQTTQDVQHPHTTHDYLK